MTGSRVGRLLVALVAIGLLVVPAGRAPTGPSAVAPAGVHLLAGHDAVAVSVTGGLRWTAPAPDDVAVSSDAVDVLDDTAAIGSAESSRGELAAGVRAAAPARAPPLRG